MKKFLAAFDGLRYAEANAQYAIAAAKAADALLVGLFLDDFTRRSYGMRDLSRQGADDVDAFVHQMDERDKEARDRSVDNFRHACDAAGVAYTVHRDRNVAIQELLQESVFADLLAISSSETLTQYTEALPTRFIRDLLNNVQCPVLLTPASYHPIDKVVLLYDGKPSSVHALRSFSYLFETYKKLPVEVLTVNEEKELAVIPDVRLLKEFIRQHYPGAQMEVAQGMPEEVITVHLLRERHRHPLVVLGAYQRSAFSRLFKPSMADHLQQHLTFPLFIAHNKS